MTTRAHLDDRYWPAKYWQGAVSVKSCDYVDTKLYLYSSWNIGGTGVTHTALANANKKRDSLAAEVAQQMEDFERDLAKIDAWIAQWHDCAGGPILPECDRLEQMNALHPNDNDQS
jgi:hypothetical protein